MKKTIIILSSVLILSFILSGYYKMIMGNYIINSPFNFILISIAILASVYLLYKLVKFVWLLPILILSFSIKSCNYAKSNQQVVVSDDCGMSWKKINSGEAVPKGGLNACYMKVVIPNYPMQGESRFISNLADKVRANIHIDYDYSITEPLAFIKQAKYLGKANVDSDNEDAIGNAFEGAENMVIDK
jgi:hypothetical protein